MSAFVARVLGDMRSRLRPKVCLVAACLLGGICAVPAWPAPADPLYPAIPQQAERMLLEADELIYDFDGETVTAVGNVTIYHRGSVLDAERVTYDQQSGRLVATGGVRMLEPGGNILTAERLDITDDFLNGFVDSLNLVTPEGALFSARSAERRDGDLLIFHDGAYSACRSCLTEPDKPPLWQIRAHRIVYDRAERVVRYRHARFEFLGIPIAYVPVFFHPDPTVRRKTGFLLPSFRQSDPLGVGVTVPFFWNLAPNYDVTFSPTFLTRQGVLMQTEWRHRLLNGGYSIRAAGILQQDKDAFVEDGERLSGYREFRGAIRTEGGFAISDQWSFGWEAHAVTDRTFNRDYRMPNATERDLPSTLYLTGLSERNFFDVRGYYFLVQREDTEEEIPDGPDLDDEPDIYLHDDQDEQALVHPVLDHNYILDRPILGGELHLDSNITSLSREESDIRHPPAPFGLTYAGVAGTFSRTSTRATWKRRFIAPGGHLVTPFSYLQADLNWIESDDFASGVESDVLARAMPAVGVEYEWPILATLGSTVHTFGPKAQLIVRPDERLAGRLPNEDSQSLIFDDTNLFAFDKFAGYDRQEGGTRANLGFLYQGLFPGGASIDALVGQSIQLVGRNSFALQDHALTGLGSGLETDVSDYLGRLTVNTGYGIGFTAAALFDDNNLQINRSHFGAVGTYGGSVASVGYAYFRESPAIGIFDRREEINAAASLEVADNWFALGSVVYDMHNDSFVSHSLGLGYADDSMKISAVYSETPDPYSDLVSDRQIFVRVNLRTLGEGGFTTNLDDAP